MPFDASKDKVLKEWKSEGTGLMVSIRKYDKSQPKVQIGPRILLKKDGSERAPMKAGRLSIEDVEWIYDIIDDIKDEMEKVVEPE